MGNLRKSFLTMGMDTWSMYSIFMSDMREFSHQIDISYSHLFFFSLKLPVSKITCHYEPSCFPGGSDGKTVCFQCMRPGFDPWVGKIPLEKEMVTHSSILPWKTPWTEEPRRLQSMGSQTVGHDWATSLFMSLVHLFLTPHTSQIGFWHLKLVLQK